jgi:hypothetical protein
MPPMSTDLIRYDLQVQDALRGVVRKVLSDAAREGLPGEHHFYITFRTQAPGVNLSNRLREQYPEEMTIILQHQFWDLKVDDIGFQVGLHFKNIPEKLVVPLDAISGFYDPSVQFGLKFEAQGEDSDELDDEDDDAIPVGPVANPPVKPSLIKDGQIGGAKDVERPKLRGAGSEPPVAPAPEKISPAKASPAKASPFKDSSDSSKAPDTGEADKEPSKVVSIDAFRKKP